MKKENSLQSFCECQDRMYLLQEWDQEKNAPLPPDSVHKGSHQKVWWHCENGHTWYSEIRVRANGSMCPYCTRRMLWVESNDLLTLNPALASEWDNEKNGELKPSDVLEGSHKYVWWKCQNGHSWRARILSRSRGAGCPVCTGKAVMSGVNDLATLFPDIAAQWDAERNGSLRPDQVTSFSNRKGLVALPGGACLAHGDLEPHECKEAHRLPRLRRKRQPEAPPSASFAAGGCRTEAHMRQSFFDYCRQYHKEALLREWDTARNAPLTPQAVTYGSHTPVWWRCENGHEWEAVVYTRTHGSGCPFCAGKKAQAGFNDLATQYPELARQWDYTKNIPVLPADVTTGSHRLVWWKCEKGHSWRASVRSRVSGNGCPVCAGRQLLAGENDLATRFPELAQEWDRQKNGTLTPESAIPGSSRRVWWHCKAGHSWFASISSRAYRNSGCPVCTGKLVLPGFNDLAS